MNTSSRDIKAEQYWRKIIEILEGRFQDLTFLDNRDRRPCPEDHILGVLVDWNWDERRFIENGGMPALVARLQHEQRPVLLLGHREADAVRTGEHGSLLDQRAVRYVSLTGPLSEIGKAIQELRPLDQEVVAQTGQEASRLGIADDIDGIAHKLAYVRSFVESRFGKDYCSDAGSRQELQGWLQSTANGMYETRSRFLGMVEGGGSGEVNEWVTVYSDLADRMKKLCGTGTDLSVAQCEQIGNNLRDLLEPLQTVIDTGYMIVKSTRKKPTRATKEVSRRRTKVAPPRDVGMPQKREHSEKIVLVVDDQVDFWIDAFNDHLGNHGFRFVGEADAHRALMCIRELRPDAVLLDILFPDDSGHLVNLGRYTLADIKKHYPDLPVVMFTSTLADEAICTHPEDYGAAAYLFAKDTLRSAPAGHDPYAELGSQLDKAIQTATSKQPIDTRLGFIVGNTPKMREAARAVQKVADTSSTVLITGETGTGKELVALAIHQLSARRDGPFVAVNCGGLTDEILESRLFGHRKGAFTGADRDTIGFFGEADGGTLFLDEAEAMSPRFQEMVLRAIQERRITRMGETRDRPIDVRILAASNQELGRLIDAGRFRDDLYHRLAAYRIDLPTLRERTEDLPALFEYIVCKKNEELGLNVLPILRQDVVKMLSAQDWPGNIRGLENAIHTAMVNTKANVLTPGAFNLPVRNEQGAIEPSGIAQQILDGKAGWSILKDIRGEMRRSVLEALILKISQKEGRRPSSARLAEILNMSASNLRRVLSESKINLRNVP